MFKIAIPKPCHEDWDSMTPNLQGRHCSSCAKTVVDFTSMTDEEVQHFFIKRKNESTCGRFRGEQLGRITITLPHNIFEIRLAYWKKFLAACLLAFSTMLFSCETKVNQSEVALKTEDTATVSTIKKDAVPYSGGYVGGLGITWDSTMVKTCNVTLGFTISTDTPITTLIPVIDTLPPEVIQRTDFMGDTILIQTSDTTNTDDSLKTGNVIKPDSSGCNNENFINL